MCDGSPSAAPARERLACIAKREIVDRTLTPGEANELLSELERKDRQIARALSELGVPGPDYPANVSNAVAILRGTVPV